MMNPDRFFPNPSNPQINTRILAVRPLLNTMSKTSRKCGNALCFSNFVGGLNPFL